MVEKVTFAGCGEDLGYMSLTSPIFLLAPSLSHYKTPPIPKSPFLLSMSSYLMQNRLQILEIYFIFRSY